MDAEPTRADVRATYDAIAGHFSSTRHHAWPEVLSFVEDADDAEVALDLGCGNGRHAELLADSAERVVALDASRALLDEAADRLADVARRTRLVQGDATTLPLASGVVDCAVYVATLHHLPSRDGRRQSLDELARVLHPGGRALVSAWSTAHDRFDHPADADTGFDTTIDWTLPDDEVVPRFYHIYAPAEFREDVRTGGLAIEDFELSSGNCYAIVRPEGKRP